MWPRPVPRRWLLPALVVLSAAAVCVRLGFWQLGRWQDARERLAAQAAALAGEPVELGAALPPTSPGSGTRVRLGGRWEPSVHLLLSGRTRLSDPGVVVATVRVLPSGERVLVERGWMAAPDARTAHPEGSPVTDEAVDGVVVAFASPPRPAAWTELPSDSAGVALWSVRSLERDSCVARLGALAPFMVRVLPGSEDAVGSPRPEPFALEDGGMHLGYALQWFGIALVIVAGAWALARRAAARA